MREPESMAIVRNIAVFFVVLVISCGMSAQPHEKFRFALLSDTHVGSTTGAEDLVQAVRDINHQRDLAFVVISGDITEMGSNGQLIQVKSH